MSKAKRIRKQLRMTPPKPATWAGEPNARELELERQLDAIERKYNRVGLTEAEKIEGVKLQIELLNEQQRRSGITLFKITPNAANDGATYDASNFFRMVKDVQMLMDAGMPMENATARALEDERFRQQREAAEAKAERGRGFIDSLKDLFSFKRREVSLDDIA